MYCDANFPNYKNWAAPLLQDGRLSSWPCSNQEGYIVISAQALTNQVHQPSEQTYKEASERSNSTPNPGRMHDSTSAFYQPGLTFSSFQSPLPIQFLSF